MDFLATFDALLQGIATLLICVAAFMGLLILVVGYLVVADLIHEKSCLSRAYTVSSSSFDKCTPPEEDPSLSPAGSGLIDFLASFAHSGPRLIGRSHQGHLGALHK